MNINRNNKWNIPRMIQRKTSPGTTVLFWRYRLYGRSRIYGRENRRYRNTKISLHRSYTWIRKPGLLWPQKSHTGEPVCSSVGVRPSAFARGLEISFGEDERLEGGIEGIFERKEIIFYKKFIKIWFYFLFLYTYIIFSF